MKITKYFLFTCKNNYNNTNNYIYNLMIKGGIIRKISSGIYIWLPNGVKIISNIINIIKFYMNKLFGIELYIPILQNSNFLKKSNRYNLYGKELFNLYNRNNKLFILSPTNEEIISYIIGNEINNDFPKFYYQIQTKFRDEIRPRYNILRSKEFIMKEAYSFHNSIKCLKNFYNKVIDLYKNIFNYIGINFYYKKASCGNIGGISSHEFHVKSLYGDNDIYIYKKKKNRKILKERKKFKLVNLLKKNIFILLNNVNFIKTVLVKLYFEKYKNYLFILIPYLSKISLFKLYNIFPLVKKIKLISDKSILKKFNINGIFFCPFGYFYQIIADISLYNWKNFVFGSNINNNFYINVNWYKNVNLSYFCDICKNINFYISNNIKKNNYKINSIELAHIFNLMDNYSKIFIKNYLLNKKKIYMGCYGIGISRLIFSIIEKYSNNNDIIFPLSISHFKLGILPINMYNCIKIYNFSFKIYNILLKNNIDILIDDRKLYFGEMINDFEVIGIPNILIISNRLLSFNLVEFRDRINNNIKYINKNLIIDFLIFKYSNYKNNLFN